MHHSLIAGKLVSKASKTFKKGAGSTWPGHIALKTDKAFIRKIISKNPRLKIVLIAGTNGKTTTTKSLAHILDTNNISTITNSAGANLINGLASTLVLKSDIMGRIKERALLFEVDENTLPLVLDEIPSPDAIILLNLFRDQLDRYGEVNATAEKWKECLEKLDETLIVANADDPQIAYLAGFAKQKSFFTINDKFKTERTLSHAVDSTTCPRCNNPLVYSKISYSHLGNYACPNCGFINPTSQSFNIKTSLLGKYNLYNLSSAIIVALKVFGINEIKALDSLLSFKPAFGRQEATEIDGKKVMLLLSKNPTGFNESLKVAIEKTRKYSSSEERSSRSKVSNNINGTILILLNDKIPDGRDISWIWDVDFEVLKNKNFMVFVSGDRCYDMANRLLFANITHEVFENYENAYKEALKHTGKGKTLTVLPTYSAMLEVRQLISGRKIL